MRKAEGIKAFEKRMKTMTLPEGFVLRFEDKDFNWGKNNPVRVCILEKPDDIKLEFDNTSYGGGHTSYKKGDWWPSFDRIGVCDSFSHIETTWKKGEKDKRLSGKELDAIVSEQLELVQKTREYYNTAVSIPGIPFTVAPNGIQALKDRLIEHRCLHFSPSGFGTGYTITVKPARAWGEKRAPVALEDFLGTKPLYMHTFDAD